MNFRFRDVCKNMLCSGEGEGICTRKFWKITMEGREKHSKQCGGGEGHCSNLYSIWGQCGGSSGIYK